MPKTFLSLKKSAPVNLNPFKEPEQVEEEWVAADAGEELRPLVTLGNVSLWCKRHGRICDQGYSGVVRGSDTREVGP